jgi:antitoxin HigA-1
MNTLPPIHPGEILRELYLEPLEMTSYALAKQLHIPRTRIERIVAEKTGITSDTALRLAKYFRTTPEFWTNLQSAYELKVSAAAIADEIDSITQIEAA